MTAAMTKVRLGLPGLPDHRSDRDRRRRMGRRLWAPPRTEPRAAPARDAVPDARRAAVRHGRYRTCAKRPLGRCHPVRRQSAAKAGGRSGRPARSNADRSLPDAGFSLVADEVVMSRLRSEHSRDRSGRPDRRHPAARRDLSFVRPAVTLLAPTPSGTAQMQQLDRDCCRSTKRAAGGSCRTGRQARVRMSAAGLVAAVRADVEDDLDRFWDGQPES